MKGDHVMKRVSLWMIGIGLFITAGLITVPSGYTGEKDDAPTCTLKTLKGRYLFAMGRFSLQHSGLQSQRHRMPPDFIIFNGDGTGTDIVTFRLGGVTVLENEVTPITYTVNPDCTGSYTVPNGPTFGLFIAPDGESIASISTDPPGNEGSGISRRVSRK